MIATGLRRHCWRLLEIAKRFDAQCERDVSKDLDARRQNHSDKYMASLSCLWMGVSLDAGGERPSLAMGFPLPGYDEQLAKAGVQALLVSLAT